MQQLMDLSDNYKQNFTYTLENGKKFEMNLWYSDTQLSWFFDIMFEDFKATGLHLSNCTNLLDPYFNILRFGLACIVSDGQEPYFLDDFVTGRVKLNVLSEDEAKQVMEAYK
ncbi:MAG: hypothetical protein J6S67_11255 [Methanobrevibacter sp.]|nr:hypothetical protein [Methanobrevibacter sp.]